MAVKVDAKLVRSVSRSFSLTLLALPRKQRHSVCLAYLLARFGDTLTDAGRWSTEERLKWLSAWEAAILQKNPGLWNFNASVGGFSSSEAELLLKGTDLLTMYKAENERTHLITDELLQTLFSGMRWDLKTFGTSKSGQILWGCKDASTFDWYCFSVAGCVGRYWIKIFNLPSNLELLAIEYGKGLQRVNILRDVYEDYARGRVYLPASQFVKADEDLPPWKFLEWTNFVSQFVTETKSKLLVGANFCDSIPYKNWRLRFASMLPLKIGLKTVDLLQGTDFWNEKPSKISRSEVKSALIESGLDIVFGRRLSSRYRQ